MQFNFNCEQSLGCNKDGFAILEGSFQTAIKPGYLPFVNEILDSMGYNSSKAQGLNTIITTSSKFFSSNHRIYIKAQSNSVIGFLKVGVKKLFIRDEQANYHEISPLCVLDFYVHESQQRGGFGKALFEYMINFEKIQPHLLAYDRPSPKLLGFLGKHYGLKSFVPQNNNYVVFNEYFKSKNESKYNSTRRDSNEGTLKNLGQQLINNNLNNNLNGQTPYNSENYIQTPNKIFANYYMNKNDTNTYDHIYSKKKINMINDYYASRPKEAYDFVREQLDCQGREMNNAKERVRQIENNLQYRNNPNTSFYNKRNEYSTVFQDKKTLRNYEENKVSEFDQKNYASNYNNYDNNSNFKTNMYTPIKPNVLPTTSSSYGAYYTVNNSEKTGYNNNFKTNNIFY